MTNKYIKGISVNVLLLGFVSFLNDLSSEMIMPILPMFISELGGREIAIGLIAGLRDCITSVLQFFSGYLSDKTGRRKVLVVTGYLSSAFFKLLLTLSQTWQHILVFLSLERVGKGLRTAPRDAIIADSMPERRGSGFGLHRALDNAGAVFGSVVVLLLYWKAGLGFKTIILISAIIAFSSLIPLHFVTDKNRSSVKTQPSPPIKINFTNFPKRLKIFMVIAGLFTLANFSYMFFILKTKNLFTDKLANVIPIMLYVLFSIFSVIFAMPFGMLSDKIGRKKVLTLGYLLFSITAFGFAISNSLITFIPLFALYGISLAIIEGNQKAFVSDLSPQHIRATLLGSFHTLVGLVALLSNLIAGFLWQTFSPEVTFIYGASTSLSAVVMFIVFRKTL